MEIIRRFRVNNVPEVNLFNRPRRDILIFTYITIKDGRVDTHPLNGMRRPQFLNGMIIDSSCL